MTRCRASLIESRTWKAEVLEEHWLDMLGPAESWTWKERYMKEVKAKVAERADHRLVKEELTDTQQ